MSTTTPLPRGRAPVSALSFVYRCADRMHLPQSYTFVRDGLIQGNVSSAAIVRAIAAAPEQQQAFLGLTKWLFPHQEGTDRIDHAVRQFGLQSTHDLLLAASLQEILAGLGEGALRAFRARSLNCALAAHFALRQQQHADSTRPLLEGLLAPLGVLLLAHLEPALMARVLDREQGKGPIAERIKATFGVRHQAVAAELLRCWGLPGSLVLVLSTMQQPELSAPFQVEAANLGLAWELAEAMSEGRPPETAAAYIPQRSWSILDLRAYDLAAIAKLVDTHRAGFAEVLGWPS